MKRKLALLLAILMFVSFAVVGCGKTKDADKEVEEPGGEQVPDDEEDGEEEEEEEIADFGGRTFTYSAWWELTPEPGASEEADMQIARIEELEEKYNCKIEFINIPWEEYLEKYITTVMAGDAIADMAIVDYRWFYPTLSLNGYCTDLKQFEDQGIFDFSEEKWNKDILELSTFGDKIYAYEAGRTYPNNVLFWNKSLFERENLPNLYDPFFEDEWTWDKMLEIAKKATKDTDGDGKIDQWGLVGINLEDAFVFSNNGQSIDASDPFNPKFVLDSPEALEGLQTWQDFILKHKVVEVPPEGAEWDYPRESFSNGSVAMFYGPWYMVDDIKEKLKDEYGVVLFPKGPKADEYVCHSIGINVRTIPSTVKDPEQVAILENEMREPLSPDPDDWREYYEDRVYDEKSIDVIEKLQDEGLTKYDFILCFDEVVQLSYTYNWEIQTGEKTPQVAIGEIAQQAQALIDNALKKKPEELIESAEDEGNEE